MSIVSPRRRPRRATSGSNGHAAAINVPQAAVPSAEQLEDRNTSLARWSGHNAAVLPTIPGQKLPALLWGIDCGTCDPDCLSFISAAAKAEDRAASPRLLADLWRQCRGESRLMSMSDPLRTLACARIMPAVASVADVEDWWAMIDRLVTFSRTAGSDPAGHGVTRQWLASELSLSLANGLADVASCAELAQCGREVLQRSLLTGIGDDGAALDTPPEKWLALLASWTRSRMLLRASGHDLQPDAAARYDDFVESLLRLARRDGRLALPGSESSGAPRSLDVWSAAAAFVELRLQRAMQTLWGKSLAALPARSAARTKAAELPPPSANSERSGLAVLRPSWSAQRLVVDYRTSRMRIRLDRSDDVCLAGDCELFVALDGQELTPQSPWEQTCWITDDDVDYLELEISLTQSIRVQRHVVFARQDEFVFLADAVLGERPATIDFRSSLPLALGTSVAEAAETRELALVKGGRRRASVLPLALGEWRTDRGRGELSVEPDCLRLTQRATQAANLFAPWFIDLAPRRLRRPVTWRRLTVAEDRETQTDDVAVGYRVQVGRQQWLFYRSLAACGNRTLLGHNLVSEFLAARFGRQGVPDTLIEIEAPAHDDE